MFFSKVKYFIDRIEVAQVHKEVYGYAYLMRQNRTKKIVKTKPLILSKFYQWTGKTSNPIYFRKTFAQKAYASKKERARG